MADTETAYDDVIRSLGERRRAGRLALVDCGGCAGALSHLANDLEEALEVYERLGSSAESPGRQFVVERIRLYAAELADGGKTLPVETDPLTSPISDPGDTGPDATEAHPAHAVAAGAEGETPLARSLPAGALIYAIACTNDHGPAAAEAALRDLANACSAHGVTWGGGVAVGGGLLVEPCAGGPRMGRMRRARSEAIDRLILAIRSSCAATDLPDAPARGIHVAKCPVPAFAYSPAVRLYTAHR